MRMKPEKALSVEGSPLLFGWGKLSAAALIVLMPALVYGVETDRITVEDPSTGTVKFKVTSAGNVTGGVFTGDGAGLTNVPHWKGAWNSGTTYQKDDCASYGGSSYIALQPSSNAQPNLTPASWAVMAQQGPAGANGAQGPAGANGAQGIQGIQGPQGPAGSADTQSGILGKLATQTNGALLSLQEGTTEGGNVSKIVIKDKVGNSKFVVQANGAVAIGAPASSYPLYVDSSAASAVPGGVGIFVLAGNSNKERIEVRSFGSILSAPSIQGKGAQWANGAPAATKKDQYLVSIAGSGHDGNALVIGNKGIVAIRAEEDWSTTAQGAYAAIETTTPGATVRTEKMRVTGIGNLGLGTVAPSQKLEVNGGVRINTISAKPTCDATTRGTLWITQGAPNDLVEVCAMVTGSLTWKALW